MAITPPYIRLSNGDVIIFEKLGPQKRAVLLNSESIRLRQGNYLIGATEKQLADTIILGFSVPTPTIIEEVLSPLPTTPPTPPQPTPTQTPEKVEEKRLQEAASTESKSKSASEKTVDATTIEQATPNDLKAKGAAKLPQLIYILGSQVNILIQPSLNKLITDYISKYQASGVCLPPTELAKLRQQRDLIVNQLNNIGDKIEILGSSITGLSFFLNTVLAIITTVDLAALATSLALKIPPASALPTPGVITTLLNDAQTLIRKVTFDQYGNSKLSKYQSVLSGSALVLSIVGGYILTAVEALKSIDNVLKTCDPTNPPSTISPTVQSIADAQLQSSQTQNQTTYSGFIIEIQEVPYTPTVTRRRALGKNQQGIVLIQTELSFTTDDLTLINELKLIIDRDNLKAY